jgi:hypothetical protein
MKISIYVKGFGKGLGKGLGSAASEAGYAWYAGI